MKKIYTRKIEDIMPMELRFHMFGEGSPRVFLVGGIHGGESTGIYVAERVLAFLEGNEILTGSVKVLPVANVAAFRRLRRTSPYDELDLNRIFPGEKGSVPSLALADLLWEEAQNADYIVDLHCCGVWGSSYTLAVYDEFDYAKDLAGMLDIPTVIQSGGTRGQLFTEACHAGIPAVIIELPGGGRDGIIDLDAGEQCYKALLNMLRQLGIIAGESVRPQPTFYGKTQKLRATLDGNFMPLIKPGVVVNKDDTIGTLRGETIDAPFNGVATRVRPACYVFKGMTLAHVAPLVSELD